MQYFSYCDKREVLQQEYSQPPILPSRHFRRVVNAIKDVITIIIDLIAPIYIHCMRLRRVAYGNISYVHGPNLIEVSVQMRGKKKSECK